MIPAIGPIRRLYCTCCGESFHGRQFHNQDTGHGMGECCADRVLAHRPFGHDPMTLSEFERTYGRRGVHFAVVKHPDSTRTARAKGTRQDAQSLESGQQFLRREQPVTHTDLHYTANTARYAKGMMALRIPGVDGWKSTAAMILTIEIAPNARYSNRERAYIVSPTQYKRFVQAVDLTRERRELSA